MTTKMYYVPVFVMGLMVASCATNDDVPGGSGLIEATEVVLSVETGGRLDMLYFDEGDRILQGDTIARIDTITLALRLEQSRALYRSVRTQHENARIRIEQANLDDSLAHKEFERISRLIKSGSVNQQQYDRAENAYRQSQLARKAANVAVRTIEADMARIAAEIKLLEKQYADCRPVSPVTGTIVTTYVKRGELVAVGNPIMKVARLDTVWVKIYLPPADLTGIKLGDRAEVDPEDGREEPLVGTVTWIASEAEFTPKNVQTRQARADLVYAVKITVANSDESLKIGMPVSVRIP